MPKKLVQKTARFLFDHRHSLLHAAAFVVAFLDQTRPPRTPSRRPSLAKPKRLAR